MAAKLAIELRSSKFGIESFADGDFRVQRGG